MHHDAMAQSAFAKWSLTCWRLPSGGSATVSVRKSIFGCVCQRICGGKRDKSDLEADCVGDERNEEQSGANLAHEPCLASECATQVTPHDEVFASIAYDPIRTPGSQPVGTISLSYHIRRRNKRGCRLSGVQLSRGATYTRCSKASESRVWKE